MTHDFNKPPHTDTQEETTQKKRIPVYILALIGIFFIALILYMSAGIAPKESEAPAAHPASEAQQNSAAATDMQTDTQTADSHTATASDQ